MLLPQPVDRPEQHILLQGLHRLRIFKLHLQLIRLPHPLLQQRLPGILPARVLQLLLLQPQRHRGVGPVNQAVEIDRIGSRPRLHLGPDPLVHRFKHLLARIRRRQNIRAPAVDHRPLLVHHVVVLQGVLPDLVVALLHPLLRRLHRTVQPRVLQALIVLHAQLRHQAGDPARVPEIPHQVILEGDIELAGAGIPLPGTTAPQLPVDPAGLVPLGSHHVQSPQVGHPRR